MEILQQKQQIKLNWQKKFGILREELNLRDI